MRFLVLCDHDAFSGDAFQVVELYHEDGTDYTFLVSLDKAFLSLAEVAQVIAAKLAVPVGEVEVEEI